MDNQNKRATGLFYSREEAETAVHKLKEAGYDSNKVSVIAKNTDQIAGHKTTEKLSNKADEGATAGAVTGGALGGITGLLVGLGTLAIPGIGPILLAGAEATAIATTLAGGAIGAVAGGLVGALVGLGIPEEKAKLYSDRVSGGSFLVMVAGTLAEVNRAAKIMRRHGVEEFEIYNLPTSSSTTAATTETTPLVPSTSATSSRNIDDNQNLDVESNQIPLYEERLVINKQRQKVGEVVINKSIETDTAEVIVPVNKEQVVIERSDPVKESVVDPTKLDFQEQQVAKMEVYTEAAKIEKQAFVREEVDIYKEVEQDVLQLNEVVRREEIEVQGDDNVIQR